jgi:hypothetical protein
MLACLVMLVDWLAAAVSIASVVAIRSLPHQMLEKQSQEQPHR